MTFNQALKVAKELAKGARWRRPREGAIYSSGARATEIQVYISGMSEIYTGARPTPRRPRRRKTRSGRTSARPSRTTPGSWPRRRKYDGPQRHDLESDRGGGRAPEVSATANQIDGTRRTRARRHRITSSRCTSSTTWAELAQDLMAALDEHRVAKITEKIKAETTGAPAAATPPQAASQAES